MKPVRVYKVLLNKKQLGDLILNNYKIIDINGDKDDKPIKLIRKKIKKLELPTVVNIVESLNGKVGRTVVRRLLKEYHGTYWDAERYVAKGGGKPTQKFRLIKDD